MLRQPYAEMGTLTEDAGDLNGAPEFFNNPARDKQAQARALAGGFGAEKRFKYLSQMLPGNTRPGVADRDPHKGTRLPRCSRGVNAAATRTETLGREGHGPARRRELERVPDQIDDDLLEVTKKAVTTIRAWYFPYAR